MRFSWLLRTMRSKRLNAAHSGPGGLPGQPQAVPVTRSARQNTEQIRELLGSPGDLIVRELVLGGTAGVTGVIIHIDGLADKTLVNEELLLPFLLTAELPADPPADMLLALVEERVLGTSDYSLAKELGETMLAILSGDTAVFLEGLDQALIIGSRNWKSRSVEDPQNESIIRGPREGFTEDLRTNTALVRRRIRSANLRFEEFRLGRRAHRDTVLMYMDGIVNPKLVDEVRRRLRTLDIDDVEGSGFVEQWIGDSFLTPFPLLLNTERPDKISAALLQGKVAILVDGDPFALVLPITFSSCIQSPEDYYQHWLISTMTRFLRLVAAFIATFLPALYISLVEYHHGMLPSKLAFSIAGAREGVPFPGVVEAFIMEITLELLREAGLRLPKPIGQTIGIVGGLVIGEAAVSAGIVSPIMVIVVAVTAIASFALPFYAFGITLRIIRFGIMIAASIFGLYGVIMCYILINIHLVNLRSFGVPYTAPFAPQLMEDWKDLVLRAPLVFLRERPRLMRDKDRQRQPDKQVKP
ncbi:spore germination protein [Paenibacillus mucilaginosus]|uniref:GerA spore germination protein n=2 Tax=Paenibacillus mucilaginosus TaxID=61624 RepID=H6NJG6_9BACL|nr:spore germination protein [Paenibacillus mucilaginosus]AEI41074.1 GerA spore germination protein [Paenibacillus mucilaginosus KNP414]AFC29646.1 GerA spore germination protein [Paenibacillus mucilaginosus 3016]MCG7211484.1 spore germination protein [Paenibacillus mucilaginosus]WDM30141.1 spore germination protein [Paenibacillus mucilaginosus]WFA18328.1 spore germination protein [Paenibacillus mucilaginosus]